jgi:A/G-specific adenine glycosylase
MLIDEMANHHIRAFQNTVLAYYNAHPRYNLPWREIEENHSIDPYKVMVSELMLQQTQVSRVIPKFTEFILQFPTVEALAKAQLSAVLTAWSGLGYYRRAKFLHHAAMTICADLGGTIPNKVSDLVTLPGIGVNTAGAIVAYSFNRPVVFIETNIRTVYIHHFFADQKIVSDKELSLLVKQCLSGMDPRTWYWALMDYGAYLKTTQKDAHKKSKSYKKQSAFEGSKRQVRGQILKILAQKPCTYDQLSQFINDTRLSLILGDLRHESLISFHEDVYYIG